MSAAEARKKWDGAARGFDFFNSHGPEKRWRPHKQEFFAPMRGKVLFLAVGTGLDIQFFPPHQDITAIDISPRMLEKARPRAAAYDGRLELHEMDAQHLDFDDDTFDQAYTSCTFCSVPDPVNGLRELRRVVKPGGELHMMNPISRKVGPEVIRDTVGNVRKAGFRVVRVRHLYLDVVKTIEAA